MAKVTVSFDLDIDLEAWSLEYGLDGLDPVEDINAYFTYRSVSHLKNMAFNEPEIQLN